MSEETLSDICNKLESSLKPLKWMYHFLTTAVVLTAAAVMGYATINNRIGIIENQGSPALKAAQTRHEDDKKEQESINEKVIVIQEKLLTRMEAAEKRLDRMEAK
jgi:transposase